MNGKAYLEKNKRNTNKWNRWSKCAETEKKIGKAGHVYIMSLGNNDLYKIGCTTNLSNRLKALGIANPEVKFIWSAMVDNMRGAETALHHHYRDHKVAREIYKLRNLNPMKAESIAKKFRKPEEKLCLCGELATIGAWCANCFPDTGR